MSTIRRLIDRLFPRPTDGYKIPLLGLDASGKTTLLYRLKLGEVVVTIPTIGFNIETIQVRATGPGRVGRHVNVDCWDVGGCGKLPVAFIRVYTSGSHGLIWLVDSCDRERLAESVDELDRHIRILTPEATNPGVTSVPILILATKQDLPNPMSLDEIRARFARVTAGAPVFMTGTTLTQNLTEGPLADAFGELLAAIDVARGDKPLPAPGPPAVSVPDPRSVEALESKLEAWLSRAETDTPPDEFLRQFETLALPAWDHYTHIRLAYLLLTIHGRQKGKNLIFDGLERYIAQSEQTRGRTFHVTMTYFWIQLVHFGIRSMPPPPTAAPAHDDEKSSVRTLVGEADDFARFLLLNPFLADGNLWAEYYSKDVMMGPAAKAGMVLPDKKPLPNLVARESVSSAVKGPSKLS
ncbi:ADP-ribosylation factor [Mycena latifolia]|nr:ADP-ribosylation factor [Mycena latifolia]